MGSGDERLSPKGNDVKIAKEDWLRFGDACRLIRVAYGTGTRVMADKIGVTPREVSDMEHGRVDPTPMLKLFWAAMGLPV